MKKLSFLAMLGFICLSFVGFEKTGIAATRDLLVEFNAALNEITGPNIEKINSLIKEGVFPDDARDSFMRKMESLNADDMEKYADKYIAVIKSLSKITNLSKFTIYEIIDGDSVLINNNGMEKLLNNIFRITPSCGEKIVESLSEIGIINLSGDTWVSILLRTFKDDYKYNANSVEALCERLKYFVGKGITKQADHTTFVIDMFRGAIPYDPPQGAAAVLKIFSALGGGLKDDKVESILNDLKKENRNRPEILVACQKIEDALPSQIVLPTQAEVYQKIEDALPTQTSWLSLDWWTSGYGWKIILAVFLLLGVLGNL